MNNTVDNFQIEKLFINGIGKKYPELLTQFDYQYITKDLAIIGISVERGDLLNGYIRFYPEDFIVEEIGQDGTVQTIDVETENKTPFHIEKDDFLYAILVKINLSTEQALQNIANITNTNRDKFSIAGLKDEVALTAQNVCLGKYHSSKFENLDIHNLFLKNFNYQPDKIWPGSLRGNRFTITVRAQDRLDEKFFSEKLEQIKSNGFINYYSFQRFGFRLNLHKIGLLILQGKFETALRELFCGTSVYENGIITTIRQNAENWFGNWQEMKKFFDLMPNHFAVEREILNSLITKGEYRSALIESAKFTKFFVWAFNSYLFNRLISNYVKNNQVIPEKLKLFSVNYSQEVIELYKSVFEQENIDPKSINPNIFNFLTGEGRTVTIKIVPKINRYKILEKAVIIEFELPAGAYATSFLPNLFNLYHSQPIPGWVENIRIDAKLELGGSSINTTLEKFVL